MDKQIYKDRILETENLTDELDDSSASWLLDWGVNQLDRVLEGASEATAGERVNALMAVMRKINRVVGKLSTGDYSQSRLAEDLSALHDLFTAAFPAAAPTPKPPSSGETPSPEPTSSTEEASPEKPASSSEEIASPDEGSTSEESSSPDEPSSPEETSSPEEPSSPEETSPASSDEEKPSPISSFLSALFGKKPSHPQPSEPETPPTQADNDAAEPQTPSIQVDYGAAAEPETPPAQADYGAEAARLLEMDPRPALEYLARDFYRS